MFRCLAVVAGVSLFLGLAPLAASAQPAVQVADINTVVDGGGTAQVLWFGSRFTIVPGIANTVFFMVSDGIRGSELWKTDGSAAGTVIVKDLCPGICSSFPRDLIAFNGSLYFSADDGVHGSELWQSDGTAAGTVLVKDAVPGGNSATPTLLAVLGSRLVFTAQDAAHGRELWQSDGTAAGTALLADLVPGTAGSNPILWYPAGGQLFFTAEEAAHGRELWRTDGTAAGTGLVVDLRPGPVGSGVDQAPFASFGPIAVLGSKIYFTADDGVHGFELWSSDGTAAGTTLFDLVPGAGSSSPGGLVAFNGRLYFRASDPAHGSELWSTDGTAAGTGMLLEIQPGDLGSTPWELTVSGSSLYFGARVEGGGRELWKSDGTAAGTAMVKDINAGSGDGVGLFNFHGFYQVGGKTLFFADDGTHGLELWSTDGTAAGTAQVADLDPGPATFSFYTTLFTPDPPLVAGGKLYFRGVDSGFNSFNAEVWASDGTAGGTQKLREINTQASAINPLFWGELQGELPAIAPFGAAGSGVIFTADDGTAGAEVWTSDGTAAGTKLIADALPGFQTSRPRGFFPIAGGRALFNASDDHGLGDLWRTDGTSGGTVELFGGEAFQLTPFAGKTYYSAGGVLLATDGNPGVPEAIAPGRMEEVESLTAFGGRLIFSADDLTTGTGEELWRSDGTTAGTEVLADIAPGADSSSPNRFTAAGSRLYFTATTAATGRELWITDGTPAGTHAVADIQPGVGSGIGEAPEVGYLDDNAFPLHRFAGVGNRLFFYADGGTGTGEELWVSDGTAAGTSLVKDIFPGARSSEILWMTAAPTGSGGQRTYFTADDGVHGRELWVSDGTAAGTRMVEEVFPGASSSHPFGLRFIDGLLIFSADDGLHGTEPWKSNGTPEGTFAIQDIAPGALPSSPLSFTVSGSQLYFTATDGTSGFELWRLPRTALSRFSDVPPDHPFWAYVEALAASGITAGCGGGQFCPDVLVNRAQTSIFLGRAIHGASFVPPAATGTRFTDVPASYWAADWIEQIATDGITLGCNGGTMFCPEAQVLRSSLAIFLLRAKHGASYLPPPATGTRFADVPASYWAAAWIEQLAAEGITNGCGGGNYCPEGQVNRSNLAAFLVRTFGLLP
jgi:ELWxxDGT repeat protein